MCLIFIKKLFIPRGVYCYKALKIIKGGEFGFYIKTRQCPFYKHLHDIEGFCTLMDELVDDQCKICGRNDFTDGEIEKMGKDIEKERNKNK